MWDSNPRVPDPQTGVLTKLHQYRHNDSTENNITSLLNNTIEIRKSLLKTLTDRRICKISDNTKTR